MKRILALILLAGAASAQESRSYTAGRSMLHIDGVFCGYLQRWEGGEARADVVVEAPGTDKISKKHVGNIRYTPIVATIAVPPAQPLLDWMGNLMTGKTSRKTLVITNINFDNNAVSAVQALQCLLTQVHIPAVDAASKDPGYLRLTWTPELVRDVAPPPVPAGPAPHAAKSWNLSSFKLLIDGLDATKVNRIEALTISAKIAENAVGELRNYEKEAGAVEISNLVVTLSESGAAGWKAWLDDFVVKGNSGDDKEKGGSLELLSANRAEVLMSLKLRNLGIASLSKLPHEGSAEAILRMKAEIYGERMEIAPALPSGVPAQGVEVAPVVALAPVVPAVQGGDQGPRDPADFPRPEGLVRRTYASSRQKTGTTETAVYSSKTPIEKLEGVYEQLLKDAGWESANRIETGAKDGRILLSVWKKGARSAQVSLLPSKEGGSEVMVSVSSK